jgi:uncharacterized RDD family membrane protein YckC
LAITASILIASGGMALAFGLLFIGMFLLRNFYFVWFELRWAGRTPGKRVVGLRVIDADGGPLRPEAVIARNLTREFEIFLPLGVLFGSDFLFPGAELPLRIVAGAWALLLVALPFLHPRRQRLGDLIGGTRVVVAPRGSLDKDLALDGRPRSERAPRHTFTRAQLGHNGIYELQVLETLLRRRPQPGRQALQAVCERIKHRIGWPADAWRVEPLAFLEDFYAAQREQLERNLQLGRRKEHKADGNPSPQHPRG